MDYMTLDFPDSPVGKESACNVRESRDVGLIPGKIEFKLFLVPFIEYHIWSDLIYLNVIVK